ARVIDAQAAEVFHTGRARRSPARRRQRPRRCPARLEIAALEREIAKSRAYLPACQREAHGHDDRRARLCPWSAADGQARRALSRDAEQERVALLREPARDDVSMELQDLIMLEDGHTANCLRIRILDSADGGPASTTTMSRLPTTASRRATTFCRLHVLIDE